MLVNTMVNLTMGNVFSHEIEADLCQEDLKLRWGTFEHAPYARSFPSLH